MAVDEHHTPGEPPSVRDEAADSPVWLPALGLVLLLLGAVFVVWQSAITDAEVAEAADEAAQADDGAAEGAEAPPEPSEGATPE